MENKANKTKKNRKKYPFLFRFGICALVFCLLFLMSIKFIINALNVDKKERLYFKETGNVKYLVCLNKNDFFEDECLNSDMSYIASLIKNIKLDFNYQFNGNINNLISSVDYEVVAKLIIKNSDTETKYYEKEYVLVPKTNDVINKNTLYNLNKRIEIDYEYYNSIATNFKSQYGVDSQSYLEVYLNATNNTNQKYKDIPSNGQISVQIPLSQKAIEIKFNTQEINKNIDKTISTKSFNINNWLELIIGIFLLLISILVLFIILLMIKKHNRKNSKFDKFINKILREYDRLIVETSTFPNDKDYNVLLINNFNELVDVRDNLRLPIMFYYIKEYKLAKFYILHDNNLYLYKVDSEDINKNGGK